MFYHLVSNMTVELITEEGFNPRKTTEETPLVQIIPNEHATPQEIFTNLKSHTDPGDLVQDNLLTLSCGISTKVFSVYKEGIGQNPQTITNLLQARRDCKYRKYTKMRLGVVKSLVNEGEYSEELLNNHDKTKELAYYRPYGGGLLILKTTKSVNSIDLEIFPSRDFFNNKGRELLFNRIQNLVDKKIQSAIINPNSQVVLSPRVVVSDFLNTLRKPYKLKVSQEMSTFMEMCALLSLSRLDKIIPKKITKMIEPYCVPSTNIKRASPPYSGIIKEGRCHYWGIHTNGSQNPGSLWLSYCYMNRNLTPRPIES